MPPGVADAGVADADDAAIMPAIRYVYSECQGVRSMQHVEAVEVVIAERLPQRGGARAGCLC